MQISGAEMAIVESKPDNVVADLRLAQPWPELQAFADSIDLESCTDMVHKHVPYGAQQAWRVLGAWRNASRL